MKKNILISTKMKIFAVLLLVGVFMPLVAGLPQSSNVVIIGGTTLDMNPTCNYYGTDANVMGATYGGCLPVAGYPELAGFTFTAMHPSAVSAASLAPYDTVVLNLASSAMACNSGTLNPSQKMALVAFVASGKKLIIYDSECVPVDYSWLPYPFKTANPGAMGANGILTIVENNTLSSSDPLSPYYIDAAYLGSQTDAVGDMNVMTTLDSNWCLDMSGTNAIQVTGPVHTYAKYPTGTDSGLIIYDGLDVNANSNPDAKLREVWVQELQQSFNPSNLPCGHKVIGITVTPPSDTNIVGQSHTVTATLLDMLNNPQPGVLVTFSVVSGPNAGASGTCSVNVNCTTDANGQVSFTYTGSGGVGTDSIKACFTDQNGTVLCDNVTKDWTTTPAEGEGNCDPNRQNCNNTACNDGIDNDGDGLVDMADPDCVNVQGGEACNDGIDNDGDGLIDIDDPNCWVPMPEPIIAIAVIAAFAPIVGYGLVRRRRNKN